MVLFTRPDFRPISSPRLSSYHHVIWAESGMFLTREITGILSILIMHFETKSVISALYQCRPVPFFMCYSVLSLSKTENPAGSAFTELINTSEKNNCDGRSTANKIWFMYSLKWNCSALFPISTFMYLLAIYIFPRIFVSNFRYSVFAVRGIGCHCKGLSVAVHVYCTMPVHPPQRVLKDS